MVRRKNHRLTIVSAMMFVFVIAFAGRLVSIQVVGSAKLDAESSNSLTVHQTLTGDRGEITTSDGTPLAVTVLRYDVTAAPVDASTFTRGTGKKAVRITVATAMSEVAKATGATAKTLTAAVTANPKADYAMLDRGITVSQYQAVTALHIPYIYLVKDSTRSYPDGAVAGNLVGFLGDSGAQAGLELQQNSCLTGTDGSETYETGADGVILPGTTTVTKEPKSGGTVTTTVSGTLQYLVQNDLAAQAKALGAQSATAIVVKVSNGDLESVADWPSVDPNNVNGTPSADLYSKAFTDLYEPGSTMKSLVASALLNTGKATPTSEAVVPDQRTFSWGGVIDDAETHPVEHLTLTGVLADSSNVGISLLGQRLSEQTRYDYMEKFGLGSPSAVGFPGEPTAPLKPVSQWDQQTDYNSMFGQGVSATAIQMAGAYQAIANHGVKMPLSLVQSCTSSSGKVTETPAKTGTRVVSASTADQVVQMLQSTLTSGTLSSMTPISGYQLSAKSGTAQVADAAGGGYGNDYITSVAGMIPAVNPQYVVLITMTKPTVNKTSAGVEPAFRQIATDTIEHFNIAPSTTVRANYPVTW